MAQVREATSDPRRAPSGVLLRVHVVTGRIARPAELAVGTQAIHIVEREERVARWSEVLAIETRRGRVRIVTAGWTAQVLVAVDGVGEPALSDRFADVLLLAREGRLDLDGTAFHALENATDALRDRFHEGDDAFTAVALSSLGACVTTVLALTLPQILGWALRPASLGPAFLLASRLSSLDPRVLAAAVAGGAILVAVAARAALGAEAGAWARGIARGWDGGGAAGPLRRALAAAIRYPAIALAVLVVSVLLALPSARDQASVDPSGVRVIRALPPFDSYATWSDVAEVRQIPASGADHPYGYAVVIRFRDGTTISTADLALANASERYFYDLVGTWLTARQPAP